MTGAGVTEFAAEDPRTRDEPGREEQQPATGEHEQQFDGATHGPQDATRPLISVITPTWRRPVELHGRCMPSVRAQTWPKVEHVIVSDGPDAALAQDLAGKPVVFDQLAEHIDGAIDYGSRARNRGLELAHGELIAYLDDDNAYRPEHLATLAQVLLDDPRVDFAYSQMLTTSGNVIGASRPQYGGIDTSIIMHRAGVPERLGMWPLPEDLAFDPHAPDWGVVSRWLVGGAVWAHVPAITVDYWS